MIFGTDLHCGIMKELHPEIEFPMRLNLVQIPIVSAHGASTALSRFSLGIFLFLFVFINLMSSSS